MYHHLIQGQVYDVSYNACMFPVCILLCQGLKCDYYPYRFPPKVENECFLHCLIPISQLSSKAMENLIYVSEFSRADRGNSKTQINTVLVLGGWLSHQNAK